MKTKTQILQDLNKNIKSLQLEKELISDFQEIYLMAGKFNTLYYSSPEVNSSVTGVTFIHGGVGYADSLVFASFYKEKNSFKVYSFPSFFYIGSSIRGVFNAIEPDDKFEENMKEVNIPENLLLKVKEFLNNNPPENADDCKDDYEEPFHDSKSYMDDDIF